VIGINSYRDFANMVASAKKDAEANVEAARKEGEAITTQYRSLRDQLTSQKTRSTIVTYLQKFGEVPFGN
jgi:hypothetical protein